MELMTIGRWMGQSWLGEAARDLFWLFPAAEIVHFFGLCLLMGAMLMIDLRLLGFARQLSLKKVHSFISLALIGFGLNAMSAIVFLCAYPENYWPATAFRLKLLAICIGGANALWFKFAEAPRIEMLTDDAVPDRRTQFVAALSLLVWITVIILGRLLPYVSVSTS
jgi:hypothetical protein